MHWLIVLSLAGGVSGAASAGGITMVDLDRDGLDDRLEQRLIERFLPRFSVSTSDCAGRPSAFAPDRVRPTPTANDGTIYARAFPVARIEAGAWVEVQFFHLWAKDCGWNSHPLDVEHVSALLRADARASTPEMWSAKYWYAAAHQDTICNGSHGARAEALGATDRGADVWIARGKHASYLTPKRCRWGCSTDRCPDSVALEPPAVVNIGERDAPLNGAVWMASAEWPLYSQIRSDFSPSVLARLDRAAPDQIVAVHDVRAAVKAFLMSTSAAAWGLLRGKQTTLGALGATFGAMGRAMKATGRTLIGR